MVDAVTDDGLAQWLAVLTAAGAVALDGDIVRVRSDLTAHEVAALREHKDAVRRLMAGDRKEQEDQDNKSGGADDTAVAVLPVPLLSQQALSGGADVAPPEETAATPRPERRRFDREQDRERRAEAARAETERATKEMLFALQYPREPFNAF